MSEKSQNNLHEVELPKILMEEFEKVAKEMKLSEEKKKKALENLKKIFSRCMFEPGEAVGIIAAQSISEPATQMSIDYNEKIIVKNDGNVKIFKIGEFVDELIEKFGCKKIENSELCDIPENLNLFVLSLDPDEKVKWKKIVSCIRHKGPENLIKIKTKSGRCITATDFHSFVIRKDNKIIPIAGKDLKVGDRIPALKHLPENCNEFLNVDAVSLPRSMHQNFKPLPEKVKLDKSFGWFVGAYLSEGCDESCLLNSMGFAKNLNSILLSEILLNACNAGHENKKVPEFAFSATEEFVSALLRGYFDGNGSISRKMIRVNSESEELIDGIKLLLTRFGIFANKCKDEKQFHLLIPYKYAPIFLEKIGSDVEEKKKKLKKLAELAENYWEKKSEDLNDIITGFGDIFYKIAKKLKYPTRYIDNFTRKQKMGRNTLYRYIKIFESLARKKNININKELKILKNMLDSDVVWDEIVEISLVKPSSRYVYDISVDGLETFTTFDGIITHNTMRTYHFAGSAGIKVTYGLPRLVEIFDAKKELETPTMEIYLKKEFNNKEKARELAESLIERKISDLAKEISIDLSEGNIKIEPQDLRKIGKIAKVIKESIPDVKVKEGAKTITVYPKEESDIKSLQILREKIMNLHSEGIKGMKNAIVIREGEDWIINTLGSNLEEVFKLEEVDETRTTTNDIHETFKVLGIEAARNVIIKEAMKTLNEQGLNVDIRHILLVADIMTSTGRIQSIGRYGVAGSQTSILARAAFEETVKHLVRASIRNEIDEFKGIFENVMIGQVIPAGTGMLELLAVFEKEEEK